MKLFAATAALVVALAGSLLPAAARDTYVQDGASLLKPATVESLNRSIDDFHRQYGKEVVIVTVPSLDGQPILAVAEKQFAQNQVNGVMLFFAKAEQKDGVYADRVGRRFFPAGTVKDIKDAMQGYLRSGNFDQGVITGTNLVIDTYRGHARPVRNVQAYQSTPATNAASTGGFQLGWLWLIALLVVGFLIVRAIFRAIAGPRMVPPGYGGGPMGGPPGYGPGGYNYGGGGMGGGGGGFFSGLLGGLGGAFIGNELFGNRDRGFGGGEAGMGGDGSGGYDNSGFQNDAGQMDSGNSSSGDYGGGGGGWGDSGGGDSGGGGGDGGGGW